MKDFAPSRSVSDGVDGELRCRNLGKEPVGETSISPVVSPVVVQLFGRALANTIWQNLAVNLNIEHLLTLLRKLYGILTCYES